MFMSLFPRYTAASTASSAGGDQAEELRDCSHPQKTLPETAEMTGLFVLGGGSSAFRFELKPVIGSSNRLSCVCTLRVVKTSLV